jgi:hypothetical protein
MDINEKNQVYTIQKQIDTSEILLKELSVTIEKLKKFESKLSIWSFNVILHLATIIGATAIIFIIIGFIFAKVNPNSDILKNINKQEISCQKN